MTAAKTIDPKRIDRVLARHPQGKPTALVNLLHDLQAEFRYLPELAMEKAASYLNVPNGQLFRVATFYESFHLKPRGKHIATVCTGTACHVRGAPKLTDHISREFEIPVGGTTKNMELTLETVNCVGACALGPLLILDGEYHGNMSPAKLDRTLKTIKRG